MKTIKILATFVLAVALLGCGKQQPRHIVILPDVSGSIERKSLEQAFTAIDEFASHLHRGDRLTIIPILGDAEAEASGRIMRFKVPANRQAYDTDLRDFREKFNSSFKEVWVQTIARPGLKTDILGAIALAEQEFQIRQSDSKQILIVLSDFIQEDSELDFRSAERRHIDIYLKQTAKSTPLEFRGVSIYLGLLQSKEYIAMPRATRQALQQFWIKYFLAAHGDPRFFSDGVGLIEQIK